MAELILAENFSSVTENQNVIIPGYETLEVCEEVRGHLLDLDPSC